MVFTLFGVMIQPCFSESYKVDDMTSEEILNEAQTNYSIYHDQVLNEAQNINRDDLVTLFKPDDSIYKPKNKERRENDAADAALNEYHQILLDMHENCHQEFTHLEHHIERLKKMHHADDQKQELLDDLKNLAAARSYYKLCENKAGNVLHNLF